MKINNSIIDKDSPAYIIAELSCNHCGDLNLAKETIYAMAEANANAVKLQTFELEYLTLNSKNEDFMIRGGTLWDNQSLYDLYSRTITPLEWHEELFSLASKLGLDCFSSPFHESAVDFLERLNCPAYKIASFEISDINLIRYVAKKGKPIILSTGVARKEDIDLAIKTIREVGNNQVAILKCTSGYPTPLSDVNLENMSAIATDYQVITGVSDHTKDSIVPQLSVAMGGRIIEKHFILDKNLDSPDKEFSLDPEEFSNMVKGVRQTEMICGSPSYELSEKRKKSRDYMRSLYFVSDLKAGQIIKSSDIRSVRPGFGAHPSEINKIIGHKVKDNVSYGSRVEISNLE